MLEEWGILIEAACKSRWQRPVGRYLFSVLAITGTHHCRDWVLPSWILGVLEEQPSPSGSDPWQSSPSSSTTAPASWVAQIHEAGIGHPMHLGWCIHLNQKKNRGQRRKSLCNHWIEGEWVKEDKHFQVQIGPADRFKSFLKTPDCNSFYNCLYRQPSISIWAWWLPDQCAKFEEVQKPRLRFAVLSVTEVASLIQIPDLDSEEATASVDEYIWG